MITVAEVVCINFIDYNTRIRILEGKELKYFGTFDNIPKYYYPRAVYEFKYTNYKNKLEIQII